MPFIVKPIEEIKSIEVQPLVDKVENTSIDSTTSLYLLISAIILILFRNLFFGLIFFVIKVSIILLFVFLTYSLFLS